jgi:hypothetical protein
MRSGWLAKLVEPNERKQKEILASFHLGSI